jgi:hypothetical protein
MTRFAAAVLALVLVAPVVAQDEPKALETTTYVLTLKPAAPPVPLFRYEFVPSFRNQTANNAALLQHRALHLLAEHRPAAKEFFESRDKFEKTLKVALKDYPKEEVRAFLKPFANVFKEMEAAARCERCEWGLEERIAAEGISVLIPDAQRMRELSFLLALRTRLHAADGKVDLALKDIQTGFALARHAGAGGTLIHFLIGAAITSQVMSSLEQVMQTPDCPNLFWSLTSLPRPLIDFRKGMEGELRSLEGMIPIPKDVDKGPMSPEEALVALDRFWTAMVKFTDEPPPLGLLESRMALAFFITLQHPGARKSLLAAGKTEAELDAMPAAQVVMLDALIRFRNIRDQSFVWYNLPYSEAIQGLRQMDQEVKMIREGPFDYLKLVIPLMMPAIDRVYGAQLRVERRIASIRAVEAVRLQAAKNDGKLPAKLAEVTVVPMPTDPATGQPFEYVVDGNKFTINVPPPPGDKADQHNHWKYVVTIGK